MRTKRYSYLKTILGESTYEEFKKYAKKIIPIATFILIILFTLSRFVHWGIISSLLNLVFGTSLIFIAYVLGVFLLLDSEFDFETEEYYDGSSARSYQLSKDFKKSRVRGIILIILGIAATLLKVFKVLKTIQLSA